MFYKKIPELRIPRSEQIPRICNCINDNWLIPEQGLPDEKQ